MIVEQSIQTAQQHLRKAAELVARAELSPSQLLELEAEAVGELQQARAAIGELEEHVNQCRPSVDLYSDLLWALREIVESDGVTEHWSNHLDRVDSKRWRRALGLVRSAQEVDPW